MTQEIINRGVEAVRIAADIYRRQGYRVTVSPSPEELPDFFDGLQPDILAESPDESVIVEVKLGLQVSKSKEWGRFAQIVREHPGWRLDLITSEDLTTMIAESLSAVEIDHRIREGSELFRAGYKDAALLTLWAGVEAALRQKARRSRIKLPDERPGTVIGTLYAEGIIDQEQYKLLTEVMRIRNRTAHGYKDIELSIEEITRLERLSTGLAA